MHIYIHMYMHIYKHIYRDFYPLEGPPHNRLDSLELSMSIRIFDLGKENQVLS
jgi:hypothetical protein